MAEQIPVFRNILFLVLAIGTIVLPKKWAVFCWYFGGPRMVNKDIVKDIQYSAYDWIRAGLRIFKPKYLPWRLPGGPFELCSEFASKWTWSKNKYNKTSRGGFVKRKIWTDSFFVEMIFRKQFPQVYPVTKEDVYAISITEK